MGRLERLELADCRCTESRELQEIRFAAGRRYHIVTARDGQFTRLTTMP